MLVCYFRELLCCSPLYKSLNCHSLLDCLTSAFSSLLAAVLHFHVYSPPETSGALPKYCLACEERSKLEQLGREQSIEAMMRDKSLTGLSFHHATEAPVFFQTTNIGKGRVRGRGQRLEGSGGRGGSVAGLWYIQSSATSQRRGHSNQVYDDSGGLVFPPARILKTLTRHTKRQLQDSAMIFSKTPGWRNLPFTAQGIDTRANFSHSHGANQMISIRRKHCHTLHFEVVL